MRVIKPRRKRAISESVYSRAYHKPNSRYSRFYNRARMGDEDIEATPLKFTESRAIRLLESINRYARSQRRLVGTARLNESRRLIRTKNW